MNVTNKYSKTGLFTEIVGIEHLLCIDRSMVLISNKAQPDRCNNLILMTKHNKRPKCKHRTFRSCLVSHEMQNDNYIKIMKCKMPKFSQLCLVSSKSRIYCPHYGLLRLFGAFFVSFAKLQNEE